MRLTFSSSRRRPQYVERLSRSSPMISPYSWQQHIQRYDFAAALIPLNARVLDVASGVGYGGKILLGKDARARSVIALDSSPEALREAQEVRGLSLVRGDAQRLPFRAHSFDAVTFFEGVEHVQNPRRAIEEAKRVLAPHGVFIVSTPVKEIVSPFSRRPPNQFHTHEFRFFEIINLLRKHFGQVELYGQGIPKSKREILKQYGIHFLDVTGLRALPRRSFLKERAWSIRRITSKGPRPYVLIAVCRKPKRT